MFGLFFNKHIVVHHLVHVFRSQGELEYFLHRHVWKQNMLDHVWAFRHKVFLLLLRVDGSEQTHEIDLLHCLLLSVDHGRDLMNHFGLNNVE